MKSKKLKFDEHDRISTFDDHVEDKKSNKNQNKTDTNDHGKKKWDNNIPPAS